MLELRNVETAYGASQVLFGVTLDVGASQVVSLLGRNGMGKTTTVKSIMGLCAPKAGEIRFDGKHVGGLPSYRIAKAGIGLVPEGRQVFPTLSVEEIEAIGRYVQENYGTVMEQDRRSGEG